ncbi:hypothetical protein B0H14DRAFT_3446408 [Mycena olivaceomarginata]|nr:hypothetical protein B0H14DRAFT_3446408 [Mycena olivaceomarginata]
MLTSFVFAAVFAAVANADHRITLRNNCGFAVGMTLSNFPHNGVDYTGPAIPDIPAGTSHDVIVPSRWNGKYSYNSMCIDHSLDQVESVIARRTPNDCFGGIAFGEAPCSMTEFTFDFRQHRWCNSGLNTQYNSDYDISNIQGFSVPQQIIPDSGAVVTCTSASCPCDQAYRPGDTSGTCGGTGPVDQATRVSSSSGYTVVYCP